MPRRGDLGIAVIGCGHWGKNYLRLLHGQGPTRLVACDVDPARREALLGQFSRLEAAADHRALLDDPGVHAVIVATTASQHYEVARAALLAGKDVLVEKPITLHSSEGEELCRIAREGRRVLMVAHTFLYNPAVRMMREFLTRGEVGSVYYLHATRTHLGLVRRDVNAVWDLATHDLSIFSFLLDSAPLSVSALGGRYLSEDKEDAAFLSLRYPGGILGSVFVSWVDSNKMREVAVIGSRARMVFNDLDNLERLKIYEKGLSLDRPYSGFGEFQLLTRDGDIWSPRVEMTEPLKLMTDHFLDCVAERRAPFTPGEQGVDVVSILEAIDRSLAGGGASIAIPARIPA